MNLTTNPIRVIEQNQIIRPEFIRLPKGREHDSWTGLSRSMLCQLILPCRENDFQPPVRSCTLRRKGTTKGVRLIDLQSLLDHINSHIEPAFLKGKPAPVEEKPDWRRAVEKADTISIHQLELNKSLRLIISIRAEKDG
ncbi:MAG TPA: hypothetical protein VNW72_04225 [Chthoniobacterales bacterium]|nr:hypothetical protein [Chthoniobacterales bacterium]